MWSEHPSVWFHGTNQRYLDDQLRKHKGVYKGGERGIYLAENRAGVSLTSAMYAARKYDSSPILLFSSSDVISDRLMMGNTCMRIYCGWPEHLFLKMDIPVIDPSDDFGFDGDQFKEELRKLADQQKLFQFPTDFDWENVTEYFGWA
jgi:hypothetical protein